MAFVRKTDISASHYPPTVTSGFLGPPPPPQSPTYDPGHLAYFDTFRNEHISRLQMVKDEWGAAPSFYTPHPDASIYRSSSKYLTFPPSDISMLDVARQQEVDDFYKACQMHRDQYKDHTGTLHPLDYFKTSTYMYHCPDNPTNAYLKCPERYVKYKDPLVFPLTLERAYDAPMYPEKALTGVYNRSSFMGRQ